MNAIVKWVGLIVLLAGLFAAYRFLPIAQWVENFRQWIEGLGAAAWIIFIAVYAIAVICMVPGSLLTLAAGVAFGLWGFPIVLAGAIIGATGAFLLARYAFRNSVQKRIGENRTFSAIDGAIADEGWKVVGLMRLSPAIPFSLQNWLLGLTSVNLGSYVLASFFGMMPGTLLYVWIGSLGGSAAEGEGSTIKYAFFAVGILATLLVTWIIGKKASAKLNEHGVAEKS